jgi:DNA-binding protein HU-beta
MVMSLLSGREPPRGGRLSCSNPVGPGRCPEPDRFKEIIMPSDSKPTSSQATITLKQMAAELAESHDLPKKQAEAVLSDLMTLTTRHLQNGDKIRLTGIGILQVQKRPARMGRNPGTGEAIEIKASKKIAFRPAKELKEAV